MSSIHYFIDGYNLLFRIGKSKNTLEKRREELVIELNEIISTLNLQTTLVFDGALPPIYPSLRRHFDALEIVYTEENQTADDYIIQEIGRLVSSKQVIVISSDRQLTRHCNNLGARSESIEDFVAFLKKKIKKKDKEKIANRNLVFQESETSLSRYLAIFEKRLLDDLKKTQ